MEPLVVELPGFLFVGIGVRTDTNRDVAEIGKLWERWMAENLIDQIPEFSESTILNLYTNYSENHREYDAYIGVRVRDISKVPDGFTSIEVPAGKYHMFLARGHMPESVTDAWKQIRDMDDLERSFVADWDVYGPKAQNDEMSEVEIFVSIR